MTSTADDASPAPFRYYPAIDIRRGRVVRLLRGDASAETVYGVDPVAVAIDLVERGASRVHVVDLDAALGDGDARGALRAIVQAVGRSIEIQVGGGLRDAAAIARVLDDGADRAILGTAALKDPGLVRAAIERHGRDRIAVALDVRGSVAVGDGWVTTAIGRPLEDAVAALDGTGIRRFVVTSIVRDGTLEGPDLDLLARVLAAGAREVVASAGIRSIADLTAVAEVGCVGAIVGRATYDGRLDPGIAEAWASARPIAPTP